jgi:hypothetical protein
LDLSGAEVFVKPIRVWRDSVLPRILRLLPLQLVLALKPLVDTSFSYFAELKCAAIIRTRPTYLKDYRSKIIERL